MSSDEKEEVESGNGNNTEQTNSRVSTTSKKNAKPKNITKSKSMISNRPQQQKNPMVKNAFKNKKKSTNKMNSEPLAVAQNRQQQQRVIPKSIGSYEVLFYKNTNNKLTNKNRNKHKNNKVKRSLAEDEEDENEMERKRRNIKEKDELDIYNGLPETLG